MEQIHEMIAYTAEAFSYDISHALSDKLSVQLKELQNLTKLDAEQLLYLDLMMYRLPLNKLLAETSKYIRESLIAKLPGTKNAKNYNHERADWIGKKLRGVDFIGADLRDADLMGANLSTSMFLTQMQINSAKGNYKTILPSHIQRPPHWIN